MSKRIIDSKIDPKMLTGDNFPEIKLGSKLYVVDNRKKTFDKFQTTKNNDKLTDEQKEKKMFEIFLGDEQAKEILALDISVEEYLYLTFCIMGAVTGEEPDKLQAEANSKNI